MPDDEDTGKLLKELRDLMILQLRQSGVPAGAIGKVLGLSAKSIQNRYSIGKAKGETTEALSEGSAEGAQPSQISSQP